jgi:hypothetical protein
MGRTYARAKRVQIRYEQLLTQNHENSNSLLQRRTQWKMTTKSSGKNTRQRSFQIAATRRASILVAAAMTKTSVLYSVSLSIMGRS